MDRLFTGFSPIFVFVFVFALMFPQSSWGEAAADKSAEARRGLVTSAQCPFSCKDLRLSSPDCRQWQQGSTCMVEDFTQPAGHRSMFRVRDSDGIQKRPAAGGTESRGSLAAPNFEGRRGLITSTNCPYTCKMAGLSSDSCKESRQGNTCMVEDFMQPAGHRSLIRVPN